MRPQSTCMLSLMHSCHKRMKRRNRTTLACTQRTADMLSDRLITLSTHLFIHPARMVLERCRDRLVSVILGPFSPAHSACGRTGEMVRTRSVSWRPDRRQLKHAFAAGNLSPRWTSFPFPPRSMLSPQTARLTADLLCPSRGIRKTGTCR